MDGLTAAIPAGAVVAIDTSAFIYYVEASPIYGDVLRPFFTALAQGEFRAVTSIITLMELVVQPLRVEAPHVADDYELLLLNYPNLTTIGVDRFVARRAAELRARYRLRPADSLHVATAFESGATLFVTNDRTLSRIHGIEILQIDAFVEG